MNIVAKIIDIVEIIVPTILPVLILSSDFASNISILLPEGRNIKNDSDISTRINATLLFILKET